MPKYANVDEYMAGLPDNRRAAMEQLRSAQPVEQRDQDRLDRRRLGLLQKGERRAGRGCRPRQ